MTSIEETGRNIEEATQKALETLGVSEDDVDVEILEEGAKGFLGIGQAPARVRVTLRESAAAEAKRPRRQPKPAPKEAPVETVPPPPVVEEKPTPAPAAEPETAPTAPIAEVRIEDAAEFARDLLQRILDALGNGGDAVLRSASDGVIGLDIRGGDAPRLIGKHGQTINAMQYLVSIAVSRKFHSKLRTVVDVEDYRGRREDALIKQAQQLARQVKQAGQEAVLDALDANERRIIHTALANDPDVYTYSEGEEPERHLVISPKK